MLSNRRRDTKPELALRKALHARGLRYRVDYRPVSSSRSRADIAFPRLRVAIYVDGCFWHGCPAHATYPRTNAGYWLPKLERNIARDRETNAVLDAAGWTVLRFWEHQPIEEEVDVIEALVSERYRDLG